jgi:protein-export membrane protein SecD
MNKKHGLKNFIFIGVMIVLGIALTVCQFNVPFTNYTYNGFASSIKLGLDLKGGVVAVYDTKQTEDGDFSTQMNATTARLTDLLTSKGYSEATVTTQNDNQIRIEVPDIDNPTSLFTVIGQPASFAIKEEKSTTAEAILTGKNIKSCTYAYDSQNSKHGVSIEFDSEGSEKFFELTKRVAAKSSGSNYIYMYKGTETEPFSTAQVTEAISGGKTFISGSFSTQKEAEDFALEILSGTYSLQLTLSSSDIVSPTLGKDALKNGVIGGAISLLLVFIFMYVAYKDLGLLADISLVIYTIILMFLLQAVPIVQLTLPGIAGIILSLGMAVDGNVVIFERIKDEYRLGKKIPASCEAGFKKAFSAILDSNVTTIIASLVLALLGNGSIRGFAITLLIGIVVSMFTSIFVTKWLVNSYLPFNSTNAKRLGLKREDNVNELGK